MSLFIIRKNNFLFIWGLESVLFCRMCLKNEFNIESGIEYIVNLKNERIWVLLLFQNIKE